MHRWLTALVVIAAGCASGGGVAEPPGPEGWTLVWSDEFDTPGAPDGSKWAYEEGYIRNNELQYYTRERLENARVEDGNLVIECRRDNWEGHEITAASLNTAAAYQEGARFYRQVRTPCNSGCWGRWMRCRAPRVFEHRERNGASCRSRRGWR